MAERGSRGQQLKARSRRCEKRKLCKLATYVNFGKAGGAKTNKKANLRDLRRRELSVARLDYIYLHHACPLKPQPLKAEHTIIASGQQLVDVGCFSAPCSLHMPTPTSQLSLVCLPSHVQIRKPLGACLAEVLVRHSSLSRILAPLSRYEAPAAALGTPWPL